MVNRYQNGRNTSTPRTVQSIWNSADRRTSRSWTLFVINIARSGSRSTWKTETLFNFKITPCTRAFLNNFYTIKKKDEYAVENKVVREESKDNNSDYDDDVLKE